MLEERDPAARPLAPGSSGGSARRVPGPGVVGVFDRSHCEDVLIARLDDPAEHWKFNPADLDERALWPNYQRVYEVALAAMLDGGRAVVRRPRRPRVVPQPGGGPARPGDLHRLDPQYPAPDLDLPALRGRLQAEGG